MTMVRLPAIVVGTLINFAAVAMDSQSQHSPGIVSSETVIQWFTGLMLVLLIFGVLIWLLRKTGHFNFESKNQLAVLTALSLGMREKLVLVKVGEKQLLLGVTPGRVDKLLELEGEDRLFQESDGMDAGRLFANKLQQAMRGNQDA
ncbi:MAG: flagellar biosynthetic protein FliO [Gammaproteobacteria bacterium]